ncbi:MAG: RuvX/YqgF family protein, partial [Bacteroidota bacterium]
MEHTSRVLGVDYGSKRVGISISDPLRILATELVTLEKGPQFWDTLAALIGREGVSLVVVGMPFTLKGETAQK